MQQTSLARVLGQSQYHEVPRCTLHDKLKSCIEMIADPKTSEKFSKAVERKILEENESSKFFELKPIFIHLAERDYKNYNVYLIFRVKHEKTGTPMYIDKIRTYSDWRDFLENNILPKCYMIYPHGGEYTTETQLIMEESEACSAQSIKRNVIKIAAVTTSIVSTVAIAATPIFPVLAPATIPLLIANASSSVVVGVDGAVKAADLYKHNESMSPTNMRAFDAYLDIAAGLGGASRAGAVAASRFIEEDASMAVKALIRCAKVAGSSIHNVSLICKCLLPVAEKISAMDFKQICLSCLNIVVNIQESLPDAQTFIRFFMLGYAIYRGETVQKLRTLNGARECFEFLFRNVLPEVLYVFGSEISALGKYFSHVICNKLTPYLPDIIDTEKFRLLKRDFSSIINKLNVFFNITDVSDIKFNGFSFFLTYSISTLQVVWKLMEDHLNCKKTGPHQLAQPKLVELWFKFMEFIRCCSPKNLIRGTQFFLFWLSNSPQHANSLPPSQKELRRLANLFLDDPISNSEFNEDKPLFPTVNNMQVHTFYMLIEERDMSPEILSEKLKSLYREKAGTVLRKKITRKDSKFHKPGNGANALLYLSPCHEWRCVIFNRTILKNGNALLFVTFLR